MDKHAGGGQSTSKSTCEVPARTLTAYLAIDQISIQHVQMEAGLNSDPGNDSFWDKIRDAKHVDLSTPLSTMSCTTVLSGAEERGVDGPRLDRSFFSRLQPISFLFYNPSSSHVG